MNGPVPFSGGWSGGTPLPQRHGMFMLGSYSLPPTDSEIHRRRMAIEKIRRLRDCFYHEAAPVARGIADLEAMASKIVMRVPKDGGTPTIERTYTPEIQRLIDQYRELLELIKARYAEKEKEL